MEEYMESELSGIFRVKLVTKNIEHGSSGTQFIHMRVNAKTAWVILRNKSQSLSRNYYYLDLFATSASRLILFLFQNKH